MIGIILFTCGTTHSQNSTEPSRPCHNEIRQHLWQPRREGCAPIFVHVSGGREAPRLRWGNQPVIQFDCFVPVVYVGRSIEAVVARYLGRVFCKGYHPGFQAKLALNSVRYVVIIVVRTEWQCLIIIGTQFGYVGRLHIRVILGHVVRNKINDNLQSLFMSSFTNSSKLMHPLFNMSGQSRDPHRNSL